MNSQIFATEKRISEAAAPHPGQDFVFVPSNNPDSKHWNALEELCANVQSAQQEAECLRQQVENFSRSEHVLGRDANKQTKRLAEYKNNIFALRVGQIVCRNAYDDARRVLKESLHELAGILSRWIESEPSADYMTQDVREICRNNILYAKVLYQTSSAWLAKWDPGDDEKPAGFRLAPDYEDMLNTAFHDIDKAPAERRISSPTFANDGARYAYSHHAVLRGEIFKLLRQKYEENYPILFQARVALRQLKDFRGALHEEQFAQLLEQAVEAGDRERSDELVAKQQLRRATCHGARIRMDLLCREMSTHISQFAKILTAAQLQTTHQGSYLQTNSAMCNCLAADQLLQAMIAFTEQGYAELGAYMMASPRTAFDKMLAADFRDTTC